MSKYGQGKWNKKRTIKKYLLDKEVKLICFTASGAEIALKRNGLQFSAHSRYEKLSAMKRLVALFIALNNHTLIPSAVEVDGLY